MSLKFFDFLSITYRALIKDPVPLRCGIGLVLVVRIAFVLPASSATQQRLGPRVQVFHKRYTKKTENSGIDKGTRASPMTR